MEALTTAASTPSGRLQTASGRWRGTGVPSRSTSPSSGCNSTEPTCVYRHVRRRTIRGRGVRSSDKLTCVVSAASVRIGSASRGLLLAWAPLGSIVEEVNATLVDQGLSASRPVYHGYTNG